MSRTAVEAGPTAVRLATMAMGTRFELVLSGTERVMLQAAGEAAIERIEELHRMLTRFEESSLLGHLRRVAPAPVPVDRSAFRLFATAEAIRVASEGGFDIGAGTDGIRLDERAGTVALAGGEVELDLGAVAKGFAIDEAGAILRELGVDDGFLHGGTSSALGLGKRSWRVSLGGSGPVVELTGSALSVSAAVVARAGARVAHIRDPRTGREIQSDRRVAVSGPTATEADGWSTAILVLGRRPASLGANWRVWISESPDRWSELPAAS